MRRHATIATEDCFEQFGDLTEVQSARLEALTNTNQEQPFKNDSLVELEKEDEKDLLLDLTEGEDDDQDGSILDEMLLEEGKSSD